MQTRKPNEFYLSPSWCGGKNKSINRSLKDILVRQKIDCTVSEFLPFLTFQTGAFTRGRLLRAQKNIWIPRHKAGRWLMPNGWVVRRHAGLTAHKTAWLTHFAQNDNGGWSFRTTAATLLDKNREPCSDSFIQSLIFSQLTVYNTYIIFFQKPLINESHTREVKCRDASFAL